ncbi:MAG: apolipoprotein N-acyltransferase [Candidatus Spechtbacterales bacterium]
MSRKTEVERNEGDDTIAEEWGWKLGITEKKAFAGVVWMLPLASGFLLALLYYAAAPAILLFVALVPLFLFLDRCRTWESPLWGGFLAACPFYLANLLFLLEVRWFGFLSSEALFMQALYGVAAIAGGLLGALFALTAYFLWRRHWTMLFVIPALWILFQEVLVRWVQFDLTWSYLGYLTETITPVRQLAALSGVVGLDFLIIWGNIAVVLTILAFQSDRQRVTHFFTKIAPVIVLTLAGAGLLFWSYSRSAAGLREGEAITVTVMNTEHGAPVKSFYDEPYQGLLKEALGESPDIILFPESIFEVQHGDSETSPEALSRQLSDIAGNDFDGAILFGGYRSELDGTLYNSFFLWEGGSITDIYDKRYLVPFAEYRPRYLERFSPQTITMYTPGSNERVLQGASSPPMGVTICQEVIYPESSREAVRQGAELLVSGANDGFVDQVALLQKVAPTDVPWLYLLEHRIARFRAIEGGRYLVRSTKIGTASIIAPDGSDVVRLTSGESSLETRDVILREGFTPFVRFGSAPLMVFSTVIVGFALSREGKSRMRLWSQKK